MEKQPDFSDSVALEARLRAASDAIHLAAEQLRALEDQKRNIEPSDAGFVELASLVRANADHLVELARSEEEFALELSRHGLDSGLATIEEVPGRHDLRKILEDWREVERRLARTTPGSPEARELVERFEALRREYAAVLEGKTHPDDGEQ